MAIQWSNLKPYWHDRTLQVLLLSWVMVSVLGYVLWIQPQYQVQRQQATQFSTLTTQHTELKQSVGLAEGALTDFPTRLATVGSPWLQQSYHQYTLHETIAQHQRPEFGALFQVDIQPDSFAHETFRYADATGYKLTARGSYQSLAAIVQQCAMQRPFLQIDSVTITSLVRQPEYYQLTLRYLLPVLRQSTQPSPPESSLP